MSFYHENGFERAFGTFPLVGKGAIKAVNDALAVGFRAFDTAQMYGNEPEVGAALATSGIPRDGLCITTKVHPDHFSKADFLPSIETSLKMLKVDFVDMLLLHWPPENGAVEPSLKLLQEAHDRGFTRNIGVSNYNLGMLRTAKQTLSAPVATNQVEFHPLLDQSRLLEGASAMGIPLSAYCPIARGKIFAHSLFGEIGARHGKSAAQIAMRWILQKGVSVNVMSTNPVNMAANFDIMNFTLSNIDMHRLNQVGKANLRVVSSDRAPWAPEWD